MQTRSVHELSKYFELHWKSVQAAKRISRVEMVFSNFREVGTYERLDFNSLSYKLDGLINLPCIKRLGSWMFRFAWKNVAPKRRSPASRMRGRIN